MITFSTCTTFTTNKRENGRVMMTRTTETRVNITEQIPGPSSQPCLVDILLFELETGIPPSVMVQTEDPVIDSVVIAGLIKSLEVGAFLLMLQNN